MEALHTCICSLGVVHILYAFIRTYVHTQGCVRLVHILYVHTCCGIPRLCTSAHALLFIRTYVCMYILHTYVCADVRICLDVCTHVRSMYVYTYIVMYMWIHTVHTYVPICSCIYILSVNVCKFSFYVCMYIRMLHCILS